MVRKVVAARRELRVMLKNKDLAEKVPNYSVIQNHRVSWRSSNFLRVVGDFTGALCLFGSLFLLLQFLPIIAELLQ